MKAMLAKPFKEKWLKPNGFIQPKLDGCRMLWTGSEAMSRRQKPILGVPELVKQLDRFFAGVPLDGELYCHGQSFQTMISSIRKTKNINEDFSIGYHVYDMPVEGLPFHKRYDSLKEIVEQANKEFPTRIHLVPLLPAIGLSQLELNLYESQGYEGTMWRSFDGLYKFGKRSSDLLKLKSFMEEEFKIIGVNELVSREKLIVEAGIPGANQYSDGRWYKDGEGTGGNVCGSLKCITVDGKEFDVGTGLDDVLRKEYWDNPPIGKLLTVKFQEYTDEQKPRFPVHKSLRDYE